MDAVVFSPEQKPALRAPVWKRILRTAALTLATVFGLVFFLIVFFEGKLIYFPAKDGVGASPGEDVWLTAADGVKIHAWYLPRPGAKVTLLHLHGNAGNLEDRRDLVVDLGALGVNVLAIDYRGYGKSEGSPDEKGLYADARAAYDWIRAKSPDGKIIVHGESLGAGPACELAETAPCDALIVQSAFTRAADMAPLVLPLPGIKLLLKTKFDNAAKVARIACPKLFLHGRNDSIIPFAMGEKLFEAACAPKEFQAFLSDHNDLTARFPKAYYGRLAKFLAPFLS